VKKSKRIFWSKGLADWGEGTFDRPEESHGNTKKKKMIGGKREGEVTVTQAVGKEERSGGKNRAGIERIRFLKKVSRMSKLRRGGGLEGEGSAQGQVHFLEGCSNGARGG